MERKDDNERTEEPNKVKVRNTENEQELQGEVPMKNIVEEEITQECRLFKNINRGLLPSKLFYFFFFAANGTLLPYLILFFKQIGLSPSQVGIVTGLKPFISFVFSPIWGYLADKTKKARAIFVVSILAYTGGFFSYSLVPTKHVCQRTNTSNNDMGTMRNSHIHKRQVFDKNKLYSKNIFLPKREILPYLDDYFRRKLFPKKRNKKTISYNDFDYHHYHNIYPAEFSPSLFQIPLSSIHLLHYDIKAEKEVNGTKKKENDTVIKMIKTDTANSNIGKFSDTGGPWLKAVTSENNPWTVCAAAKANPFENIFLSQNVEKLVSLEAIFYYLLTVTVVATLFSCPLITIVDTATIRKLKEKNDTHKYGHQRSWGSLGWGLSSFGVGAIISTIPLCPGINNEVNYHPAFIVFAILLGVSLVIGINLKFYDDNCCDATNITTRTMKIKNGLRLLKDPCYFVFMFTSFYIGVTMSIIKTFLFWHLKDLGGTQILFSLISAVNCVAEVFIYFISSTFIKRIGHIRVLYTALICYSLRLFYYGLLKNPWYVLAAEPLSGITTAAAWASMTSYVGLNGNKESVTTLQGILHGVHWGLGHGCGELLGGFMVSWIGAALTFNIFGFVTIIELVFFILINRVAKKHNETTESESNIIEDINENSKRPSCH